MEKIRIDSEILYVQKLYFFLFLFTLDLLLCAGVLIGFNSRIALVIFLILGVASYTIMIRKKSFPPPAQKIAAQRIAREISQDSRPLVIARVASQLYFYFHETERAVSLLENYLPSRDPLVCATLADIMQKEGKSRQALFVLRENPYALIDPLLLAMQGHVLRHLNRLPEAIKMYERCLRLAREKGFPHNGAHWFTQRLLTLAYTASIHHALADCYAALKDWETAKRHYWAGNIRFLDITFWRRPGRPSIRLSQNYTKLR